MLSRLFQKFEEIANGRRVWLAEGQTLAYPSFFTLIMQSYLVQAAGKVVEPSPGTSKIFP